IREACEQDADLAQAIVGIHQEGPYISADDGPRGAHPKEHVRPASWDEFRRFQDDAAHGMIKMLTLAPETPGALPFIEKVAATGKYRLWDHEFEVLPAGKIVAAGTPYLAGSWAFTDLCVGNTLKLGETSQADTIDLASNRPRELLGLPARQMAVGEPAELIL